jgi:hypothetical protein
MHWRREKIPFSGNWKPVVQPVAQSLYWLSYFGFHINKTNRTVTTSLITERDNTKVHHLTPFTSHPSHFTYLRSILMLSSYFFRVSNVRTLRGFPTKISYLFLAPRAQILLYPPQSSRAVFIILTRPYATCKNHSVSICCNLNWCLSSYTLDPTEHAGIEQNTQTQI